MLTLEKPLRLTLKKPAKTDSVFIVGKEDTAKRSNLKLLDLKKISVTAMKNQDYSFKTGSATIPISIKASFCVVDVKD
jgi:hypothetical protein